MSLIYKDSLIKANALKNNQDAKSSSTSNNSEIIITKQNLDPELLNMLEKASEAKPVDNEQDITEIVNRLLQTNIAPIQSEVFGFDTANVEYFPESRNAIHSFGSAGTTGISWSGSAVKIRYGSATFLVWKYRIRNIPQGEFCIGNPVGWSFMHFQQDITDDWDFAFPGAAVAIPTYLEYSGTGLYLGQVIQHNGLPDGIEIGFDVLGTYYGRQLGANLDFQQSPYVKNTGGTYTDTICLTVIGRADEIGNYYNPENKWAFNTSGFDIYYPPTKATLVNPNDHD